MKTFLVATFIITILGFGIYTNIALWNECRATNSWLYCAHVIGR